MIHCEGLVKIFKTDDIEVVALQGLNMKVAQGEMMAIIGNSGQASVCGWCKDKWGLSWQITPRALSAAMADPDRNAARRAFEAMMQMGKIDIAAIEAARRG